MRSAEHLVGVPRLGWGTRMRKQHSTPPAASESWRPSTRPSPLVRVHLHSAQAGAGAGAGAERRAAGEERETGRESEGERREGGGEGKGVGEGEGGREGEKVRRCETGGREGGRAGGRVGRRHSEELTGSAYSLSYGSLFSHPSTTPLLQICAKLSSSASPRVPWGGGPPPPPPPHPG
jgi:hypothetical protein